MKKFIIILLPWYISIISLLLFNINIPIIFIALLSVLYLYITYIIKTNYSNNKINKNDIFNIILLYILNNFFILFLFYYNYHVYSFIVGIISIYLFFNIKLKNV